MNRDLLSKPTVFDVNDEEIRQQFLTGILPQAVSRLKTQDKPAWGNMTAQHMLEHLIWAFRISRGLVKVTCNIPEGRQKQLRVFLYNNNPTPRYFKNPELPAYPVPLEYAGLDEAQAALQTEILAYLADAGFSLSAMYIHPLFGQINAEEWERSHYKHCFHHLLQFNLIEQKAAKKQ